MATGVHIITTDIDRLMDDIDTFAEERDDVVLVGEGTTRKGELHFVVIEFDHAPDVPFLQQLDKEDSIEEVSVYTIIVEGEEDEDEEEAG